MAPLFPGLHLRNLRGDLLGGVTAAVVALPLALAFGVSSGVGAIAGVWGAIIVGFFAALFGGTPSQISGPTGPMTVVMAAVVMDYAARFPEQGLALAFTVVMLAGLIQVAIGALRLGKYIVLVPFGVISGFMSGVGVIIILLQLGPLLGHPSAPGVLTAVAALPAQLAHPVPAAAGLGVLSLALIFVWPHRIRAFLPPPLAALVIGTLLLVFALPPDAGVPQIGEIPSGFPTPRMPTLEAALLVDMLFSAVLLAGLGAIDSLLTSLVADNITRSQHHSDRELVGQGVGNMLAGLVGGLPGAGATMRTVINIRTGGKTQISGMAHAVILLAIVLGAGDFARYVPHAVLAGILIKVGIDIIDWRLLRRLHRLPLFTSGLMLGVMFLTVFVDLITAVLIGTFVANLVTIERLTHLQLDGLILTDGQSIVRGVSDDERGVLASAGGHILLLSLAGPMSFGVARGINERLASYQGHRTLVLDLEHCELVGFTTCLVIEDLILAEQAAGRKVVMARPKPAVFERLEKLDAVRTVPEAQRYATRAEALRAAAEGR